MTRIDALRSYRDHGVLGKVYARLQGMEITMIEVFIAQHDHLGKGDFERAINRMFLDVQQKPKGWKDILELLACSNSAL